MAKRFTATEKWDKAWFRELPPRIKCLWDYMTSKCDGAGVWDADFHLASFQIGESVCEQDLELFGDRVVAMPNGKILIADFIEFQYGELSSACKPHLHVLRLMDKHGAHLWAERVPEGFRKGKRTFQEKDPEKETEGEGVTFP